MAASRTNFAPANKAKTWPARQAFSDIFGFACPSKTGHPARVSNQARTTPAANPGLNLLHWSLLAAFGAAIAAEMVWPRAAVPIDGLIFVLAAGSGIVALTRQLPLQNVLLAAAITAGFGSLAHGLSARTALPFGPFVLGENAAPLIFQSVGWLMPFLWIAAVFSARGVARLGLRPWRKVKTYGYWLIGLTTALTVGFDLALEPFAGETRHLWFWQPTKLIFDWYGASPLNFLAWAFVTGLILAFASPALIRKQPGSQSAPDYAPLLVWLGLLVLFAVGAGTAGLRAAVSLDVVLALVTTVFALRGARW